MQRRKSPREKGPRCRTPESRRPADAFTNGAGVLAEADRDRRWDRGAASLSSSLADENDSCLTTVNEAS